MSTVWAQERLGHLLAPIDRAEPVDPSRIYRLLGARWYAQGLFVKEEKSGHNIKANTLYRVKAGDFVYNRLFAWKGSFAIADDDANDCHVSNEFPCFAVNRERLDSSYLKWWFSRESAWLRALGLSSGATPTSRNRLKEAHLLGMEIPLPPLDEQRRIVARIDELAAKVEEARNLNDTSLSSGRRLLSAMAHRADLSTEEKLRRGWQHVQLQDVLTQYSDPVPVVADGSYPNFGIYSFGRGLFPKPSINGMDTSATQLYRARAGLFIYCRLFAFEGAYGLVENEYDRYFVSNEYPMFACDDRRILPEFLAAYMLPASIWWKVAEGSGGLGHRRQRVQPHHFLKHEVLLPPLDWQQKIRAIRGRIANAAPVQEEVANELNALLPAILDKAFKGEL